MSPRLAPREDGYSLIELLVVLSLLSLALVMFGTSLIAVQNSARTQERIGTVTDELGIALAEFERHGRSAYWVRDVAVDGAFDAVRMYTADGSGGDLCITWKVADDALWMQRGSGSPWRLLADGVANADDAIDAFDAGDPVLVFDPSDVGVRVERDATLVVVLLARPTSGDVVRLGTMVTARNVLRGAADPC